MHPTGCRQRLHARFLSVALAVSAFATTIGTDITTTNITTSGSLGIGTTTPWRALSVEGDSDLGNNAYFGTFQATNTAATSTIAGGLAIETSGFVYDYSSGRVGIGITNPTQPLHVYSATGPANIKMQTGSGNAGVYLVAGSHGWAPFVPSTQDMFNIWSDSASGEVFTLGTSGNLSIGSYAGIFAPSGGLIVSGSVGIGTTSPASLFSLSSSATTTVHIGTTATSQGSCIQMYAPNHTAYRLYVANDGTLTTEAGTCE